MTLFEISLAVATILFALSALLAVLSLHSDREGLYRKGKTLFLLSSGLYLVPGLLRYYPFNAANFVDVTASMWGYFYLLALFLILTMVYFGFSRWKSYWKPIAAITLPFISVMQILSLPFIHSPRRVIVDLENNLLPVHISVTMVGELFFFFSFAGSVLYAVLELQLRKKSSMKFIYRLPSLESIDKFNLWAITWSLGFLSAGLLVGIGLVYVHYGTFFLFSPKEIIIYVSWLLILLVFLLRYRRRISSFRISLVNILLFLAAMSTFVATNIMIRAGFHSFK